MQPDADKTANTSVISSETNHLFKYFETTTNSKINYNRYNTNLHYTLTNIGKGGVLNVNADYLNYTLIPQRYY